MVFVRFEILTVVLLCDVLLVEQFMTSKDCRAYVFRAKKPTLRGQFDHDPSQQEQLAQQQHSITSQRTECSVLCLLAEKLCRSNNSNSNSSSSNSNSSSSSSSSCDRTMQRCHHRQRILTLTSRFQISQLLNVSASGFESRNAVGGRQ